MEHRAANTHTHRTIQGNREAPEALVQLEKRSSEHLARIERLEEEPVLPALSLLDMV